MSPKYLLLMTVVWMGVLVPSVNAADPTALDGEFIRKAASTGRQEVADANSALKLSTNALVIRAAQMMRRVHANANHELAQIAARKGWSIPHAAPSPAASRYSDMNYIIDQIQAHQLVIALFEQEAADGNDTDLQGFARRTLPRLEFQLLSLKSLQSAGNADADQRPSRALGVLLFET